MLHIKHTAAACYPVAIILKESALIEQDILKYYINPMIELGAKLDDFISIGLPYDNPKKVTNKFGIQHLNALLPQLDKLGTKYIYCTDGNYAKMLAKIGKIESVYGYPLPCKVKGYEHMQVICSVNHQALFTNDALQEKITLANKTLIASKIGCYVAIGSDIIKHAEYHTELEDITQFLHKLHSYPVLTCDTETFSLYHHKAGLGTIGFAWNVHEGGVINVQHVPTMYEEEVNQALKQFFVDYKGKLIFHNATYDLKVLIYYLWMDGLLDTNGLIEGLEVLTRDLEDTRVIAYLATNSCAKNPLGLKTLAHEFAGDYAVDVKDIRTVSFKDLSKYNLVDCLSTWFVFDTYYPIMVQDEQEQVYRNLFMKMVKNIVQMELTGMPINMERTIEVDGILEKVIQDAWAVVNSAPCMVNFKHMMAQREVETRNAKYKKKVITVDDVNWVFNPNSNHHLIALFHDYFGFEVYHLTDTKQPSVSGDALKGHSTRGTEEQQKLIKAILDILEGEKIRNTFVKKFLEAVKGEDGWHYLFGSFNIGGTKSGRLSSSEPNLQNLRKRVLI